MSSNRQGPPPQSKPSPAPGIRPADFQALCQRVIALEKLVRERLDEKNEWNVQVREWIGKVVVIHLLNSAKEEGTLRWVDRYTLCLEMPEGTVIVHKGAVATIRIRQG